MTNPYTQESGAVVLQESWFCFLDILGFSEIIRENDHDRVASLHEVLRRATCILDGDGYETKLLGKRYSALTSFTDNIALGIPISSDGEIEAGLVFERIAQFQLEMVLEGFFVRGGISVGEAYIDDLAVYGPALLQAHEGESKFARDPRIVLTESARELVSKHLEYYARQSQAPQNRALQRDRDGQWFVDYLQSLVLEADLEAPVVDFSALTTHKDIVSKKLSSFTSYPKVWSKYEWVALYHNDFCSRHAGIFDESYLINLDAARGQFGSILDND